MNIKKTIITATTSLLLLTSLAACGDKKEETHSVDYFNKLYDDDLKQYPDDHANYFEYNIHSQELLETKASCDKALDDFHKDNEKAAMNFDTTIKNFEPSQNCNNFNIATQKIAKYIRKK